MRRLPFWTLVWCVVFVSCGLLAVFAPDDWSPIFIGVMVGMGLRLRIMRW